MFEQQSSISYFSTLSSIFTIKNPDPIFIVFSECQINSKKISAQLIQAPILTSSSRMLALHWREMDFQSVPTSTVPRQTSQFLFLSPQGLMEKTSRILYIIFYYYIRAFSGAKANREKDSTRHYLLRSIQSKSASTLPRKPLIRCSKQKRLCGHSR